MGKYVPCHKISDILSYDNGRSDILSYDNGVQSTFHTGSSITFVLYTTRELTALNCLFVFYKKMLLLFCVLNRFSRKFCLLRLLIWFPIVKMSSSSATSSVSISLSFEVGWKLKVRCCRDIVLSEPTWMRLLPFLWLATLVAM